MNTHDTVARAVRMEVDPITGDLYLVFRVIDEAFKQKIRENWEADVQLKVLGKDLIKYQKLNK